MLCRIRDNFHGRLNWITRYTQMQMREGRKRFRSVTQKIARVSRLPERDTLATMSLADFRRCCSSHQRMHCTVGVILVTKVDMLSRFGRDNSVVWNLVNKDGARPRAQAMILLGAAVTTLCEYAAIGDECPSLVAEENWTASTHQMGRLHPRPRFAECTVARHQMFEELIVELGQSERPR